ncbi:hypothetical protein [Spirillospora sp. NPDC047279]|uniref:hypothetical protein n=1 Tax=Spirillospora sp. NPDC047279 TaxID=3155478 RepID=UPI0033CD9489
MGIPHYVKAALLAAPALALLAGCSKLNGGSHAGHDAPQAKAATIEQLAQQTGCTLSGRRNADELRQGACQTGTGRYTVVGFTTDQGQKAWLEEAKPWGGSYLVGKRWIIVATAPILETLRHQVGGDIVNGRQHHGT